MPQRIAHFIDTKCKGGAEVTLMDLCVYQRDLGFDVFVFHVNNEFIHDQCIQYDIQELDIPAHRYYKSVFTLPLYTVTLVRKLKELKIDVLHSHLFGPITGNAIAAKLSGTRHVGTIHDIYSVQEKPTRSKLLKLSHYAGTKLVCVSEDMTRFYQSQLQINPRYIHTIYNAVKPPKPPFEQTQHEYRLKYGLEDSNIVIATVGRLVELKRFDWLIQALSVMVKKGNRNVKLLIIGAGPEYEALQALTYSLDITDHIVFTGEVSFVNDLLAISDIYAQFSRTEGLSRSIIEAISWGLPCVVSDVGGNRELVIHENSGFVLPANNLDLLVEHLTQLITDEPMRKAFSRKASKHFRLQFDHQAFQDSYLGLYA